MEGRAGKTDERICRAAQSDGSAQVILGVGMAAGKARAAVTQRRFDGGQGCAGLEKFSRYPFVGDASVGGRIALQDAQAVQAGLIQGSQRCGIEGGMGNQARWVPLDRSGPRWRTGWKFGGGQFEQSRTATGQAAAGIDQFHPRSQTVTVAPLRFAVGESGQSSQVPPIAAGGICRIDLSQPPGEKRGDRRWKRLAAHSNPAGRATGPARMPGCVLKASATRCRAPGFGFDFLIDDRGSALRPCHLLYTSGVQTTAFRITLVLGCLICATPGSAQNADAAKSKPPVATVGGRAIYDDDLIPSVQAQLLRLRNQEYELKKKALDSLIEQKLLEAAAKKNGIPKEKLLEQQVDAKVQDPTNAELEAYYLGQKERLNRPFDEVKDQLRQGLKQARVQQARQDYLKRLRASGDVVVLLAPPKVQVGYDPARLRGDPKAPVMVVEFSDYQCPYCRQVETTLKNLLAKYPDKVSLAYRDFPITQSHPQAELAAEASRCAGEQGKFWEYHDQLINASNLERVALLEYARALKLDEKHFDSCLGGGKYKAEVERDVKEGTQAGVSGTPGFFINGVLLSGAQAPEAFARVIDEELARKR